MGSHHAEAPASSGGLSLHPHVGAVLYSEEVIAARVRQLATELSAEYKDKNPVVLQARGGDGAQAPRVRARLARCTAATGVSLSEPPPWAAPQPP